MKKRLLSFLLVLALMVGIMPATVFAAVDSDVLDAQGTQRNPFAKSLAFNCYEYHSLQKNEYPSDASKNHFGGGSTGSWISYRGMNFGSNKGGKVTIYYGLGGNYDGSFDVRLGSSTGDVIANVPTATTGGWEKEGSKTVEIATPVTGDNVDIYVTWNGTAGNFFGIQFDSQYTSITGPTNIWLGANDAVMTNDRLARLEKVGAEASIDRNQEAAENRKANIMLAEYSSSDEMISFRTGTEQAIVNGLNSFVITPQDKTTSVSYTAAYFWYDDNTIVNNSATRGTVPAQDLEGVTISSSKMDVTVTGELVEISGTGVTDERVIVLVVPGKFNSGDVFYKLNPVYIWEATVSDGQYYRQFILPNAPTGDYTAIVMGSSFDKPETKEFSYTNPSEIYSVLQALDASLDKADTISILQNNATMFGTQSALYTNMQDSDMQIIHDEIKDEFFSNPLTSAVNSEYGPWVERITNAIVPDVIMGAVKGSKNLTAIADNILKYAQVLGLDANAKFNSYFKTPAGATSETADTYTGNREQIVKIMVQDVTSAMVAADIVTLFDASVAVGMFNAAKSWGYADAAINNFESEFSADMQSDIAIYKKLENSYKMEVMNKFLGRNFADKAAIEALMASIIDEYNNPEYFKESKYELEQPYVGDIDLVIDMLHSTLVDESEEGTSKNFTDLGNVSWASSSITYMASMGYVNGKSDTTFAPNDPITREEFAAILVRTFGFDTTNAASSTFADVDNNAWYAAYVATAAQYGIVNGLENNTFGVGQQITREQIATMLKRTVDVVPQKLLPFKGTIAFADFAYISDWAYSSVMYLARAQIINGTGNDQFSPKKNATRAEAVVMIHRLLQNLI